MSANGNMTVGEHLRSGMKNLLADTFDEVAQRAVDKALEARSSPARPPSSGMTVFEAVGQLAWAVTELAKRNSALKSYIVELEADVTELRQRPTMEYQGVWNAETLYAIGDFATDGGSIWHCERACTGVRPGSREDVWTLSVKHGRDGRDAKGR